MAKLSFRFPLDPWTARRPKASPDCPHAPRMRRLLAEYPLNVVRLHPTAVDEHMAAEIRAGIAHCIATCGGCALTRGYAPP